MYIHCVKSVQIRNFFWSVFYCIRTEILRISLYSVRMRESTDQKSSLFGHFSRSDCKYGFGFHTRDLEDLEDDLEKETTHSFNELRIFIFKFVKKHNQSSSEYTQNMYRNTR